MKTFYKIYKDSEEIYEYIRLLENGKAEFKKWSVCLSTEGHFYFLEKILPLQISDLKKASPDHDYKFQK